MSVFKNLGNIVSFPFSPACLEIVIFIVKQRKYPSHGTQHPGIINASFTKLHFKHIFLQLIFFPTASCSEKLSKCNIKTVFLSASTLSCLPDVVCCQRSNKHKLWVKSALLKIHLVSLNFFSDDATLCGCLFKPVFLYPLFFLFFSKGDGRKWNETLPHYKVALAWS